MTDSSPLRQFKILQQYATQLKEPAVSVIARQTHNDPFAVLVATLISLRTLDAVTGAAATRLLSVANSPGALLRLSAERIAKLIHPTSFSNNKALQLQAISRILLQDYDGRVPKDSNLLLALPGVGRKSAALILALAFDMAAVCVDTHVHRIANRIGWIDTSAPHESETELMALFPRRYWSDINEVLVRFGIALCRPLSPYCSRCPLTAQCPRNGVTRHR